MTTITSTYLGGLRCSSIHGPSGATLLTDAPTDNQGKGEAFSPTDLLATALATCILTIMGIIADRHGLRIEGSEVRVEKTMSSQEPRRVVLLEAWIRLPNHLAPDQRELLRRAGESCPVKLSLEGAVPMRLHWG